jgi:phosphate acyltransferase
MVTIAIDCMGGDYGSASILEGVRLAQEEYMFRPLLVGNPKDLLPSLSSKQRNSLEIVESSDVIQMHEAATDALRRKESSIFKTVDLVRNRVADGLVSAGHSGSTMSLATLRIGRVEGVVRPAIATLMPKITGGENLMLDVGANVDCKPEHLVQFAIMGREYAKNVMKKLRPRVGLLSNGEEESKGNELTKEAFKILQGIEGFVGNVEGNDIFNDSVDVIVCDGFEGNLVLKTSEGVAEAIASLIKQYVRQSPINMLGAMLLKNVFHKLRKKIDYAEYGGAPLLGIRGCAVICHGKSNPKAIKNAINQAIRFIDSGVNTHIQETLHTFSSQQKGL